MPYRKKICCIADAPGPAEFLAPVIPLLAQDHDVSVIGIGTAIPLLKSQGVIACDDESAVKDCYEKIAPDMLISAISSLTHGPYINNLFIEKAHQERIPIILLQDCWGNHRCNQNKNHVDRVSIVCVPDNFAASLWQEDGFKGEILVTGNPAFDRFIHYKKEEERKRIRNKLHINPDDRVIVFAGQGTPMHLDADKKTFAFIAQAIRAVSKDIAIKLIIRHHPRAEEHDYYKEYAQGIAIIDTSFAELTEEILPAADVVISMFSTNLLHACFMRIPGVSVLLPQWGRGELGRIGLDDFPPNQMRATIGIYDDHPAILTSALEHIFSDESFCLTIQKAQEKNFISDGKAAQRVADVIHRFEI